MSRCVYIVGRGGACDIYLHVGMSRCVYIVGRGVVYIVGRGGACDVYLHICVSRSVYVYQIASSHSSEKKPPKDINTPRHTYVQIASSHSSEIHVCVSSLYLCVTRCVTRRAPGCEPGRVSILYTPIRVYIHVCVSSLYLCV